MGTQFSLIFQIFQLPINFDKKRELWSKYGLNAK